MDPVDIEDYTAEQSTSRLRRDEFLKAEYVALRAELVSRLEELWKNEKWTFAAAGATAAWLILNLPGSDKLSEHAWWLPFILLVLGGLRSLSFLFQFRRFSSYIKTVEEQFLPRELGWEHLRSGVIQETAIVFLIWIMGLGLALFMATEKPSLAEPAAASAPQHEVKR